MEGGVFRTRRRKAVRGEVRPLLVKEGGGGGTAKFAVTSLRICWFPQAICSLYTLISILLLFPFLAGGAGSGGEQQCGRSSLASTPLGVCTFSSGISFHYANTLPSGGSDAKTRLAASVPGTSRNALFFFSYTPPPTTTPGGSSAPAASAITGFECKRNTEVSYVPCTCGIQPPVGGPWTACAQLANLGSAGRMQFAVRAVAAPESDGGVSIRLPPATFTWTIDTVPAVVSIGVYANEEGVPQGGAPAPCANPEREPVRFELVSNEWPRRMECRLSRWDPAINDFRGAPERWSAATVAKWLTLASTSDSNTGDGDGNYPGGGDGGDGGDGGGGGGGNGVLSDLEPELIERLKAAGVNGATLVSLNDLVLRDEPYAFETRQDRDLLLNAVAAEAASWTTCAPADSPGPAVHAYDLAAVGHGLLLFQARAVDVAGNKGGAAAEYIWYADRLAPATRITSAPPEWSRKARASFSFTGIETLPNDGGARYTDHNGVSHTCANYTYRLLLDGYDITPTFRQTDDEGASLLRMGRYEDNMNARARTRYNYVGYKGSTARVSEGDTREFSLQVVAVDVAGNEGPVSVPYVWNVDRRTPASWLTRVPAFRSSVTTGEKMRWLSDESGVGRHISYTCKLDGQLFESCANESAVLPVLRGHTPGSTRPVEHTFEVLATDEAGNAESFIKSSTSTAQFNHYTWFVDDRPPVTRFVGALPPAVSNWVDFEVRFASDEPSGRFECLLTREVVVAVGGGGGGSSGGAVTKNTTETLAYAQLQGGGGEVGGGQQQGDGAVHGVIRFPGATGALADGEYSLRITAIDSSGNRGNTVTTAWRQDTLLPVARLSPRKDLGTQRLSSDDYAEFDLTSEEKDVVFECALDCLRLPTTCGQSSQDYLVPGGARGKELVSVCLPHNTPQLQAYTAPDDAIIALESGGLGGVHTAACKDRFGTADDPVFFRCGGLFGGDGSGGGGAAEGGARATVRFVGLRAGLHVLRLRARDRADNVGPLVTYGFSVDLEAPVAFFAAGSSSAPPAVSTRRTAVFKQVADESRASFECELSCLRVSSSGLGNGSGGGGGGGGGGGYGACPGQPVGLRPCGETVTYTQLTDAEYRYRVRAIDAAGNRQYRVTLAGAIVPSYAVHKFVVDLSPPRVAMSSQPGPPAVTSWPVVTFDFSADEADVSYECRTCRQAPGGRALCTEYAACTPGGGGAARVQTVTALSVDQPLFAANGDLNLCTAAINAGCGPRDLYRGPGGANLGCARGALDLCQATVYSYANARIADMELLSVCNEGDLICIRANMIVHTFSVRAIDAAGNIGPPADHTWRYDTIAPQASIRVVASSGSGGANEGSGGSGRSNDLRGPVRPFDVGGGVLQSSVAGSIVLTKSPEVTLVFNTTGTEDYPGNLPVKFRCQITPSGLSANARQGGDGSNSLLSGSACSSPLVLSSLDDIALYVPPGLPALHPDSLFTLAVTPVDAAGNAGPPATVTWGEDKAAPGVTFPNGLGTTPSRSRSKRLDTFFVCTKSFCRFECQLECLTCSSNGNFDTRQVLVPWSPCAWRRERFVVTLEPITAAGMNGGGGAVAAAEAAVRFLRAKMAAVEVELKRVLSSSPYRLEGVVEASATLPVPTNSFTLNNAQEGGSASSATGSSIVTLTFTLVASSQADPATDSFQEALLPLTRFDPADTYNGRSRSERDAQGRLCDCAGCATMATCTSGAGQTYDCPCVAQYAGSGAFEVASIRYDGVAPVSFDVSAHLNAPPASTRFAVAVRAYDNAGALGAASRRVFVYDAAAPGTVLTTLPPMVSDAAGHTVIGTSSGGSSNSRERGGLGGGGGGQEDTSSSSSSSSSSSTFTKTPGDGSMGGGGASGGANTNNGATTPSTSVDRSDVMTVGVLNLDIVDTDGDQPPAEGGGVGTFRCRLELGCSTAGCTETTPAWSNCPVINRDDCVGDACYAAVIRYAGLKGGRYRLHVGSVDMAGNFDPGLAVTVSATVSKAPPPVVRVYELHLHKGRLTAVFGADEPESTLRCRIVAPGRVSGPYSRWSPCESPIQISDSESNLDVFAVTFEVVATDLSGTDSATACGPDPLRDCLVVGAGSPANAVASQGDSGSSSSSSSSSKEEAPQCPTDQDLIPLIVMGIGFGIALVGGVTTAVLYWLWWRLPDEVKMRATFTAKRAFVNPAFRTDRNRISKADIGTPSNFQHVAAGTEGLISGPSNFRHVGHIGAVPSQVGGGGGNGGGNGGGGGTNGMATTRFGAAPTTPAPKIAAKRKVALTSMRQY